jgi:hypothetical protein
MEYKDFEVTVLPRQQDRFPVRIKSPAGDNHDAFTLPFDEEEVAQLIPSLSSSVARGTTRALRGDAPPPERLTPPEVVGGQLFEALFSGRVRSLFERSLGMLYEQPDVGLRIKLCIDPDEAPELARIAGLPWEYLYRQDTRDFLSLSMRTPVVRYLEVPRPTEPLRLDGLLRVLFVLASPNDQAALDLEGEKQRVEKALGPQRESGHVEFEFVEGAGTMEALRRKLDEHSFHVIHFMGHGDFDSRSGEGLLCFETADRETDRLSARKLMTLLGDYRSVRLVFLNACQTAVMASEGEHYDAFMGVAPALVMGGVTAVIAMQFPISDEAAQLFSGELYSQLAGGAPVDEAVSKARQAVQVGTNGQEWGTPVLFMRAPDGRIFDAPSLPPRPQLSPIEATVPPDGAVDVSRWLRSIQIRFKPEMQKDDHGLWSGPGGWFGLPKAKYKYDRLSHTFTVSRDNAFWPLPPRREIRFAINRPDEPPENTGRFRDAAGNPVASCSFSFTTRAAFFSRSAFLAMGAGLVVLVLALVLGFVVFRPRPSAYVAVVLDNGLAGGVSGLEEIKTALREELTGALPTAALALHTFGERCGDTRRPVNFSRGNTDRVIQALAGVEPVARADLVEAIRQALDGVLQRRGEQPRVVIVVTWGVDGCGGDLAAALASYRQQLGSAVNLYLINLGDPLPGVGRVGVQNSVFTGLDQARAELARILDALALGQVPAVMPSRTPTSTPTSTHTATWTPTLSPTPTRTASPTPSPSPSPTLSPTPTFTPTLPPLDHLDQPWNVAWQNLPPAWKQKLGAVVATSEKLVCVRQQFQGGFMFWCDQQHGKHRTGQGPNMVYAVEQGLGGNRAWYVEDTWTEAEGETPCIVDLPELQGGIRKVWCEHQEIREALLLPTEEEWELPKVELVPYGWGPGVIQFEGGHVLWDTFTSRLWVLIADFGWKSFSIGPGTVTPSPTSTFTPTPTPTATPTPTDTLTPTPTNTLTPTPTETLTPTPTSLPSPSPTP